MIVAQAANIPRTGLLLKLPNDKNQCVCFRMLGVTVKYVFETCERKCSLNATASKRHATSRLCLRNFIIRNLFRLKTKSDGQWRFCYFSANANENNDKFLPNSDELLDETHQIRRRESDLLCIHPCDDFDTFSVLRLRVPSNNKNPLSWKQSSCTRSEVGDSSLACASAGSDPKDWRKHALVNCNIGEPLLELSELDRFLANGTNLQPKAIKNFGLFESSKTATLSPLHPANRLPRLTNKPQHRPSEKTSRNRQALRYTRSDPGTTGNKGWRRAGSASPQLLIGSSTNLDNKDSFLSTATNDCLQPLNRNTNATVTSQSSASQVSPLTKPVCSDLQAPPAGISLCSDTDINSDASSLAIRLQDHLSTASKDDRSPDIVTNARLGTSSSESSLPQSVSTDRCFDRFFCLNSVQPLKLPPKKSIDLKTTKANTLSPLAPPSRNSSPFWTAKYPGQGDIETSKRKNSPSRENELLLQAPKRWSVFKRSHLRSLESYRKSTTQQQQRRNSAVLQIAQSFSNNRSTFDAEEEELPVDASSRRRELYDCCSCLFCLPFDSVSFSHRLTRLRKLQNTQSEVSRDRNAASLFFHQASMGCFHSVAHKTKVGPCRTTIHSDVQASIDPTQTIIEEYSPIVLRYRTPYFRATAVVTMPPITKKETWTVGWIQACDHMKFINQYGNLGW